MKALITHKIGMTSAINDDGTVSAITLLGIDNNVVTQIKNVESDGYIAYQLGFGKHKKDKMGKAQAGHLKASKSEVKKMREIRVNELSEDLSVGSTLSAETFTVGDIVKATGISKGKGWA